MIIDTELNTIINKKQNPIEIKQLALEHIDSKYNNFAKIYTDGSKEPSNGKVGAAYVIPHIDFKVNYSITNNTSVYTAELVAIIKAMEWIKYNNNTIDKILILSDSLSSLISIANFHSKGRQNMIQTILQMADEIIQSVENSKYAGNQHTAQYKVMIKRIQLKRPH